MLLVLLTVYQRVQEFNLELVQSCEITYRYGILGHGLVGIVVLG